MIHDGLTPPDTAAQSAKRNRRSSFNSSSRNTPRASPLRAQPSRKLNSTACRRHKKLQSKMAVPRSLISPHPFGGHSMNLRVATAIIALALMPSALFAAVATFNRTLQVNGPATLNVSTGTGYIHITPGPDGSIHITGHIHASSSLFSGSAEQRAKQVADNPPITQNGNSIEIGQNAHYSNVTIDYVITAPRGTAVQATSGAGEINVTNLCAPLSARVDAGNIYANELTGNVALTAGSGNITAMMNGARQIK